MSNLIDLESVAATIGVSPWLVEDVIRCGSPFPVIRKGRKRFVPESAIAGILSGESASVLVQNAIEAARRGDDLNLEDESVDRLKEAVSEARSGHRLARTAASHHKTSWREAWQLLLDATVQADRLTLPRPTRADLENLAMAFLEEGEAAVIGSQLGDTGVPIEVWDELTITAGDLAAVVRSYAEFGQSGNHLLVSAGDMVEVGPEGNRRYYVGSWTADDLRGMAEHLRERASPLLWMPPSERASAHAVADWLERSAEALDKA